MHKICSMQKLKNILLKSLFGLIVLAFSSVSAQAQQLNKTEVKQAIDSKNFVFKAQTVLPMTGMSRYLTTEYDVKLLGDSVVAYLPYFGRAYSVTYGEGGGIDFTSSKFDYKVEQRRKGGWNVTVTPEDTRDVRQLSLAISENGYATLQVISNNKQPISYNGYITERKRK